MMMWERQLPPLASSSSGKQLITFNKPRELSGTLITVHNMAA